MRYTIHWLEHINPEYVCDDLDINFYEIDEEEYPENYKKVVTEILSGLPIGSKHSGSLMGDWEFECSDTFEADSIEEAKEKTKEYECGQSNVFSVNDDKGNKVFDDVDVYEVK